MTNQHPAPSAFKKFAGAFIAVLALVAMPAQSQTNVAQIKSFGNAATSTGSEPFSRVIEGSDHLLYGTTFQGGTYNKGTLFKVNMDGSGYLVLHSFAGPSGADGRGPIGELTEGKDGILYGTTYAGGTNDAGCVFKLNKDGTQYSVLRNLGGTAGSQPHGGIIEGSDGYIYGVTYTGGANSVGGTVFKLSKTGDEFTVLRNFDSRVEGANSYGGLIEGLDGALYGTLAASGSGGNGSVWKINKSGTGFVVLRNFFGTTGQAVSPHARLVQSSAGVLYGTTQYGGPSAPYPDSLGLGTIFKIDANGGGYQVIYSFPVGGLSGKSPQSTLVLSGDETTLYGQTFYGGSAGKGVVFKAKTDGSSLSVLQNFTTGSGGSETTGILLASDGLLYGTKYDGGANGSGFLYRLSTAGTGFTTLHDFTTPGGGDGAYPQAQLATDGNGTFYGTTINGGNSDEGTVYTVK
ncbi:MAG: hypothetical protein JWN25_271, partial [Verrucomicrobiales bacterium]|nr:hypothetical protein [Verrucomicrobiales bacterium]